MSKTVDAIRNTLRLVRGAAVVSGRAMAAPFRGHKPRSIIAGALLAVVLVHTTGINPVTAFTIGGELSGALDAAPAEVTP